MAEIVPFPAVRRVSLIRNMARLLATYSADAAERSCMLASTRRGMRCCGVASRLKWWRARRGLELAIRTRLWTVVTQSGDVA